jgi:ABC-2 type transport system permease protein
MKKTLSIITNEIVTMLTRPSFWVTAVGIPLVGWLIFGVIGAINKNASASQTVDQIFSGPQGMQSEGYVDQAGIIRIIPEAITSGAFVPYPDEAAARQALSAGEITAFYIVPSDYLQTGNIIYIRPDFNPLSTDSGQTWDFQWILRYNLVGGDGMLSTLASGPLAIQDEALAAEPLPDQNNQLKFWTPYAVTMLFYFLIIGSASLLLNNISKEKENRVVEVLLTSVTSRQLLTGKIIALGLLGLGQTIMWLGTSYLLLDLSGRTFNLPASISLPFSFVVWGLVFFILGYAVYASLMAGLGALAPNLREATQVTFVIMLPLIVPLFFSSTVFMQDPNGSIATALSLFPLSAPVAMMARLSAGGVTWWHPVLSAVLLAATAMLIIRLVAGMFRAQTLLSGQPIKIKTYFQALFGRL